MILAGGNSIEDAVSKMMRIAWGKGACEVYNWTGKCTQGGNAPPKESFQRLKNIKALLTSKYSCS